MTLKTKNDILNELYFVIDTLLVRAQEQLHHSVNGEHSVNDEHSVNGEQAIGNIAEAKYRLELIREALERL